MAEEEQALGLQGTKRIENIQMGLARAEDVRNSTRKSIYLCKTEKNKNKKKKTVMKGDLFWRGIVALMLQIA